MKCFTEIARSPLKRFPLLPQLLDALLYTQTALFVPRRHAALDQVERAVLSWPGVRADAHRFGGTEFRLDGAEIGHLHGNGVLDLPFTQAIKYDLIAAHRACGHHTFPHSGWVTFLIRSESDVPGALSLLRLSYSRHQCGTQTSTGRYNGNGPNN